MVLIKRWSFLYRRWIDVLRIMLNSYVFNHLIWLIFINQWSLFRGGLYGGENQSEVSNLLPFHHSSPPFHSTESRGPRITLGLPLGGPIVVKHTCVCRANVNVFGKHGLSCRQSGGRIPRHAAVNEIIRCDLVSGGVPTVPEPMGVCHDDGMRPNGMTLIPWRRGEVCCGLGLYLL